MTCRFMDKLMTIVYNQSAKLNKIELDIGNCSNSENVESFRSALDLIGTTIEFVPRLFLIYASLISLLYADLFNSDLQFASK